MRNLFILRRDPTACGLSYAGRTRDRRITNYKPVKAVEKELSIEGIEILEKEKHLEEQQEVDEDINLLCHGVKKRFIDL